MWKSPKVGEMVVLSHRMDASWYRVTAIYGLLVGVTDTDPFIWNKREKVVLRFSLKYLSKKQKALIENSTEEFIQATNN